MKKVSFVTEIPFQKNYIFDRRKSQSAVGSFDKYYRLDDCFRSKGYEIATNDIHSPDDSSIVLYFDIPKKLPLEKSRSKSYLLAIESTIIKEGNFDRSKHKNFNKIFTWNDAFVGSKNYIKLNYAFNFPKYIDKNLNRKFLCCLIVSNKSSEFKNELYSERKNLIRWFERNHPEDFHLYGYGWGDYRFEGRKIVRALNRIPYLKSIMFRFFSEEFSTYKGTVDSKYETMKNYRFAIAYENVKDELGYITEKMFDVFISGCVPVYWGAKNVTDYVPENCFVDRRKFGSHNELYEYLQSMPDEAYIEYLNNIEAYLNSEQAQQFSAENFAKTIVDNCIKNFEND